MGLPEDAAVGSGEEDIGIVGRGEVDQPFPFVLAIEKRDEMRMLRGRNVFAHATDDGAADEGGSALQFGELIDGNVGVGGGKIGSEALAPSGRLFPALVREADGKDQVLRAAWFREVDFRIVEGFALDGRDGLGVKGGYSQKEQGKNQSRRFDHCSIQTQHLTASRRESRLARVGIVAVICSCVGDW